MGSNDNAIRQIRVIFMNIVVPIAGKDRSFDEAGQFKPFVDISGKTLIARCTDSLKGIFDDKANKIIFIVLEEHERKFSVTKHLKEIYGERASTVLLPSPTEGAACSVLAAKDKINNDVELLVYLADIHFSADVQGAIERCKKEALAGFIPCFPSSDKKYSYAVSGADGFVKRVAEKDVISTDASAGFYFFSKGQDFVSSAEQMVGENARVNGMFYVCPIYNWLIARGGKVLLLPARYDFGLGYLEEIKSFTRFYCRYYESIKHRIFSHRGIFASSPENSFAALAEAAVSGFSIELDVRMTKDGVLVVAHDPDMSRPFGVTGIIEDKDYCEISSLDYFSRGTRITRLDEFLPFFRLNSNPKSQLALHAKKFDSRLADGVARELLRNSLVSRAFVFDISCEDAMRMKDSHPYMRAGASIVDDSAKAKSKSYYVSSELDELSIFDVFWLDEWSNLYGEEFLGTIRASGKEAIAISPELHRADGNRKRPADVWENLINWGCGNICTDYSADLYSFMVDKDDKSNHF